jgi:ribosomal protein S18 acetylase RimI-like enzyme
MEEAKQADLKEIIGWVKTAAEARQWGGPRVRFPMSVDTLAEDIEFDQSHSFVIRQKGNFAAFGQIVTTSPGPAHLARIIVNPPYRGMGIGRMLLEGLVRYCDDAGYGKITLNVYTDNEAAVRLYRACGFVVDTNDIGQGSIRMIWRRIAFDPGK